MRPFVTIVYVFLSLPISQSLLVREEKRTPSYTREGRSQSWVLKADNDESVDTMPSTERKAAPETLIPPPRQDNSINISPQQAMMALGTSPRRIFLSFLSGGFIALAGNLFGVTSTLLTLVDEKSVESTGLDTYFPRGDYKRVRTVDYTYVIPKQWVADTAVELAKAQRRAQSLDYAVRKSSSGAIPDSGKPEDATYFSLIQLTSHLPAYGPPGRLDSRGVSQGDTNVSVIKAAVSPSFSLSRSMGTPTEGANFLLENSIAPPNSGRTATLIEAGQVDNVYTIEYSIDRGERGLPLHAISVLAQAGESLFTLTVQAPDEDWRGSYDEKLRKIADSFHLR